MEQAEVLAAGASFIGGCCGTSPEFIRELHRLLRAA
jgi:S-methylmethionine-dependent homocysteine/selenocysteine methylase